MEHNLRLVKAWAQKVQDRESQIYYQRVHVKEARARRAEETASLLFSPGGRLARFHTVDTVNQAMGKICDGLQEASAAISNVYRVNDTSKVPPRP